ncbi:hypothetical protein PFICI_04250 [Pestalotiopsis fici W106-1]|uniref:Cryptic loci regulator 2 N-terminal domain-containing protein n=1 Tax=Pestalotiopsis fici (strain W106-1 / CGMCC3.15140) TaxID=1229662 RepID=W3X8M3_PESFW|nr:uncharacterized protein PFICI_04250 [Pestalotiopsis fici W106-1]ETS82374.1 hypothetical protein PFICI_04250 [Pestalotiopsis fici W106-1]
MAAVVAGAGGQLNPSRQVFEFALRSTSSDGKLWPEEQYKAAERLNPDDSEIDKRKYQEFLLKLGGLLRDQFLIRDPVARTRNYILKELPENYHIRRKPKTKADKDKRENHDYFIYGHPLSDRSGNPRSYATANEFFHHLIWIIGGSNDQGDCACKLCNKSAKHEPEALKKRITAATGPVSAHGSPAASPALQATSMRRSASASSVNKSQALPRAAVQPQPAAVPHQQQQQQQQPIPVPVPAAPAAAVSTAAPAPTPVPAPTPSHMQTPVHIPVNAASSSNLTQIQTEARPSPEEIVIFREGEIVWYKNNNAWRLGVVLEIVPPNGAGNDQPKCLIKPLAHSAIQLENVLKTEPDMRPYLAFSVPPVNMREIQGRKMSQVDWHQYSQYAGGDRQKQEMLGLEASKLAVAEINDSYSTFNNYAINPIDPNKQSVGGLFLGAERICVNEAVRYRLRSNENNPTWIKSLPVVMHLREIYVAADGLHFVGDIYRLEERAMQQPMPTHGPLPAAMIREQQFRSEIRKRAGTRFDWVLISQNQDRDETSIRGRFYEAAKLLPIIDLANFQAALSRGIVSDVQSYLNTRLETLSTATDRRKQNRREALSTAVPDGFFLSFGPDIRE